jgi:hypothetical protein
MPGMTLNRERRARAASRVEVALDSIQEAQQLVEKASQALSASAPMRPERTRLGRLSHQLICAWLAVAATSNRAQRRTR